MTNRKRELLNVLAPLIYMALGTALFSAAILVVIPDTSKWLAFKIGVLLWWWLAYLWMAVRVVSLVREGQEFEWVWDLRHLFHGIFRGLTMPWTAIILHINYETYRHFGLF